MFGKVKDDYREDLMVQLAFYDTSGETNSAYGKNLSERL
jgi:hypothetical protein